MARRGHQYEERRHHCGATAKLLRRGPQAIIGEKLDETIVRVNVEGRHITYRSEGQSSDGK